MRSLAFFLAALLFSVVAGAQARLEVHFIDVGQGDAILIKAPGGKHVLIDAGGTGAGGVVDAYLTGQGVGGLDLAIASHPHLDHMGGLVEVLQHHAPALYVDPGYAHPLENYDQLLDWLENRKVPARTARAGRTITIAEGVTLELLAPSEPLLSGTRSDANSNSVVARLDYGEVSFLFVGDAEAETESRLVHGAGRLDATVLKVAHHGGRHSTTDPFLRRVSPKFAVVSCGQINGYGHPAPSTLDKLAASGARVFRTDQHGDVIARTDGHVIDWETTGDRSAKLDEPGGPRSLDRSAKAGGPHAERSPRPPSDTAPIDLNTATAAQIERLPGIGASLAAAVVADREARGAYPSVDALERVRGVGRGLVDRIRSRVVVSAVPSTPLDAPTPVPVAPQAAPHADANSAPRPVARPGIAYRGQSGERTISPMEAPVPHRLLAAGHRARLNLNLAGADAIASVAAIPLEAARRLVARRERSGPFRSLDQALAEAGLGDREKLSLGATCTVRLDLNHATERDLIAIGLAPEEARAIVMHRATNPFDSVDELENVAGLPPQHRLKLLQLVTVEGKGG